MLSTTLRVGLSAVIVTTAIAGCARRTVVKTPKNGSADVQVSQPSARRDVVVVQPAPPPAPPTETMTVTPGPGYTWVAGAYEWRGGRWEWVPGRWLMPTPTTATWEPGKWRQVQGGWVWEPGHWRPA